VGWAFAADSSRCPPANPLKVGFSLPNPAAQAEPKAVNPDFSTTMPRSFLLLLFLCGLPAVAAPKLSGPQRVLPAINSLQLSLTVVQSGIPLKGPNRKNALSVTLKKIGDCAGQVTIKAYFFEREVTQGAISVNKALTRECEAVAGAGNTYVFESNKFVYTPAKTTPRKTAKGTDQVVPAKGFLPYGVLVQVFAADKLIATHASSQGFEAVVEEAEAEVAKKAARTKRAR
jgi:hypothetical protein